MNLFMVSFLFYFYINSGNCLWKRGVVHYAINNKDYDYHSQDIMSKTFEKIQREVCVKFFKTPVNYSANEEDKILYISNPDKRKDCPAGEYDFDETVVDMKIGYKCLNEQDITKMAVEMLRASVRIQGRTNNLDAVKEENGPSGLLTWKDRNFINYHYNSECGELVEKAVPVARKSGANYELTEDNDGYYKEKIWPLGIVFYSMDEDSRHSKAMQELRKAMTTIEIASCVIFHDLNDMRLIPKNILWFSSTGGEDMPRLGLMEGNQSLHLPRIVEGDPGHTAHTLNLLLRILGVPMMSNRYDRDNYVTIHWKNIKTGMEHYLERLPEEAAIRNSDGEIMPYDYTSATHAPSNYLCADCSLGQQTVSPVQDHLWQRTLSMGHRTDLNLKDIEILDLLYTKECQHRFRVQDKK